MKLFVFAAIAALLFVGCSAEKKVGRLNCPGYKYTGMGHDHWKLFVPKSAKRRVY